MPQGVPTPPLVGGTSYKTGNTILQGYVFQSGIHKPEHSSLLTWKYPQYYLTSFLDRLGRSEGIAQDTWSWNIMDRTRKGGTVTNVANNTTATATFEVPEYVYSGTDIGYAIVGDVLRLQSGELARVTAVAQGSTDTDAQKLTVVRVKGGNWSATLLADNMTFGHSHNLFGEASSAPNGRLYLPTEDYNVLSILRRSYEISGSEFTNRTYLGDGESWYFTQDEINMKEFARDREDAILFGQLNASGVKSSRGVYDYVQTYGVKNGYSAAAGVSEDDILNHIKDLRVESGRETTYLVLCGSDMYMDAQKALRDYHISGGVDYGTFGGQTIGLDVQQYKFFGSTAMFVYYELFDDEHVVPAPSSTVDGTVRNFSDTSLWLDLGSDESGHPMISLKHKELGGRSRKFIHKYEVGMMGPVDSNVVSSGKDAFSVHLLSEIGAEMRLANRNGILGSDAA